MNSRAYISAIGDMLLNGIDETTMSVAFEQGEIPDTTAARFLASIPCALALGAHYLAYAAATLVFGIALANIPLRLPGKESDTNPLVSKLGYRNRLSDMLEHLGLDKDGFINHLLVEVAFPTLNMAAFIAGFAFIGWAGLIAFVPATLSFGAQMVNNALTLYNIIVPMVTSFPEITIMGAAIAAGGLITAGYDWFVGRMEVSRKTKEAEKLVHEGIKSPNISLIKPLPTSSTPASPSLKGEVPEHHNGPEYVANIKKGPQN
jgi:hypothetical protein